VSALLGWGPKDANKPKFGTIVVWGLRERREFGDFQAPARGEFVTRPDGSGLVSAGGKHLAVDFSGASGAPLLLVGIGIGTGQTGGAFSFQTVQAAGQTFTVMTLSKGKAPEVAVVDDKIQVGGQTVSFDGQVLVLAK
jgi:hypothetical protein